MVGGTKRPPQDSESGPWSHEQSNTKSNSNTKPFHEEESQNLSRVHVSLDNADTVIDGWPTQARFWLEWGSFIAGQSLPLHHPPILSLIVRECPGRRYRLERPTL